MKFWKVKTNLIKGTSYREIYKKSFNTFKLIKSRTKRKPHLRSKFFKRKVFFDYFWKHLNQKPRRQRKERLKYFDCAIDLIENSLYKPTIKTNPNKLSESLYRFYGQTINKGKFVVQIKETKDSLQLMSIFPKK
jgi:hypothetical protein